MASSGGQLLDEWSDIDLFEPSEEAVSEEELGEAEKSLAETVFRKILSGSICGK